MANRYYEKLALILSDGELERIKISEGNGELKLIADVHGMKCIQAKRFLSNIINVMRTAFQLIIIHGFNHGTAIRDMLSKNFINPHIAYQYVDPYNEGMTHILVS